MDSQETCSQTNMHSASILNDIQCVDPSNEANLRNEAQDVLKNAETSIASTKPNENSNDEVILMDSPTKLTPVAISMGTTELMERTESSEKPSSSRIENVSHDNDVIDVDNCERKDFIINDERTLDFYDDAKGSTENEIVDLVKEEDLSFTYDKDKSARDKLNEKIDQRSDQRVGENRNTNEPVMSENVLEDVQTITSCQSEMQKQSKTHMKEMSIETGIIELDDSSEEINIEDSNDESIMKIDEYATQNLFIAGSGTTDQVHKESVKSANNDIHIVNISDELFESVSQNPGERSNVENHETDATEESKEAEPPTAILEAIENTPSVGQHAQSDCSKDIDSASSKCNGNDDNVEHIKMMDGVQESADVFELMKENEHLFDSDKLSNCPENEMQPLDDAETTTQPIEENENEDSMKRKDCINVDCSNSSSMFHDAPEFIINHFHLKKRHKQMFVCDVCFDECIQKYGEICASLQDKQPIFLANIKYSGSVELIDSSDEEDEKDKNSGKQKIRETLDAGTLKLIENELEDIIKESFAKIDMKQQMNWNQQILATKIEQNKSNADEVLSQLKVIQKKADKMYLDTYSFRNTFIEEAQSLDLITGQPTQIVNEFYPPAGQLKLKPLSSYSLYYSFRKKQRSWIPCKYEKEVEINGKKLNLIRFLRERRNGMNTKPVPLKHIAHGRYAEFRLNIGTRIIALCNDNDGKISDKTPSKICFFPGVIAEPLKSYTKWRYLVFFDDGYVKYVQHEDVRVICEQSEKVWELIDEEGARNYIEDYVKNFKQKRPIVQTREGQKITTEFKGQWHPATVKNIDGSLVQVCFDGTQHLEWIYRGSTRLHPLFRRLNGLNQTVTGNRAETTFEYIVIEDDNESVRTVDIPKETLESTNSAPTQSNRSFASQAIRDPPQQKQRDQKRAVAKKSTASLPKPTVQHMNNSTIYVDEDKPKGKVVYYTAKRHIEPKKFVNHACEPGCLFQITHNLKPYSPLSKPLLSGWERQICRTKFNKKVVAYRGPCGRRLRDITEVHHYLRITACSLNVENFDFDPNLHCLAEYVVDSYVMKKTDLSEGVEQMAVSCVNSYDNSEAPPLIYSTIRTPTEGVNLNLDPEFLCGCDCTDDCKDKTKCQCWQLTLAGAKYGNPDTPIDKVGYEFKRLYEHVPLGIYECNSRCKCKSNCLNRVVQKPLQIKLQVFKTVNRGWGIRSLNDLPRGSFVCIYSGSLLTEKNANDAGENHGDEYFAELDYIEVVSHLKEGYESDAMEESESSSEDDDFDIDRESQHSQNDDTDDDEFVSRHYTADNSIKKRYRTRNSVDTRKKQDLSSAANGTDKKKEAQESDSEGESRLQKNFMASNTMPDDPDDIDANRSIRALYGNDEAVYVMDAKKTGNMGRYFNHSCGPNLFVQNVFVDTHDLRFPWVAFFAISHIRAGTELTWNYNYEVGSVKGKVLICQCGDANCRGRIL